MSAEHLKNLPAEKKSVADTCFFHGVLQTFSSDPKYRRNGALGSYIYDEPHFEGDRVQGGPLYKEWVSRDPMYYLYNDEKELIEDFSHDPGEATGNMDVVYDLGPGPAACVMQKTLPWLHNMEGFKTYKPVDIAAPFVEDAETTIGEKFPDVSISGMALNFQEEPLPKEVGKKCLLLYFGSTISNTASNPGEKFLDNQTLRGYLQLFTHVAGKSSEAYLVFAHDCNQDEHSLVNSYKSEGNSRFILNVLEKIRRDLKSDIDPRGFCYEPRWKPFPYNVIEHTFIAVHQQKFYITDPLTGEEHSFCLAPGDEFVPVNSFKPTAGQMQQKVIGAGWDHIASQHSRSQRLCMHLCKVAGQE